MNAVPGRTAGLADALAHAARLLEREPALAAEQAREILGVVGPHPAAECLLAQAEARLGQWADADQRLRSLVDRHPAWPVGWRELGRLRLVRGDAAGAEASLGRAVALAPADPDAWRLLADLRRERGDEDGAQAAQAQALRHATRDPRLMAAADALVAQRLPEAERLLKHHLHDAPTDVAAIRMLAEVAARLGRLQDAANLLARCLELAPAFQAARQNYAMVLHRANEPEAALAQVEHLLARDARDPAARNLKAVLLCRLGDYVPAIALYDELLRDFPAHARIWLSLGHALKTAGQRDRAIEAYRRSLALDPGFGEAYWSLANLKTFRFEPGDREAMQAQLARDDLDPEQRAQFHFALGKLHEDADAPGEAFRHYAEGNALRRAGVPYRADDATARVRRSVALFTPAFLRDRERAGCPAEDPIFVVGLPRSGSTLVEQILSSHPQVEGTMELPEVIAITHELRKEGAAAGAANYHEVLAALPPARLRELGEAYLARTRVQRKTGAPRFIDKMPNNFFHVGLIHLMLPNARIIDTRRHPMACGFSGFKQYFARGQNFSYGLGDLGRYYRDYLALMAHVDAVLPGRVHRVVYERMVDDTEAEVRRLLAYCGLPWDDACLRFFENDRPVRTASSEQVRQPIYRQGLDQWRAFEPWLGPLKEALGSALDTYPEAPPDLLADYRPTH